MKEKYDVIVIGAGPAGGQCARNIAKSGLSVLLVERFTSFYDNNFSSAGMSLEGFNEFKLPEFVVSRYWKNFTMQSSNECKQWIGNENKGVVLDFAKFRQYLANDCVANGGDVLMGFSYVSKEYTKDGEIIAHLQSKKRATNLAIKAKLLVDATGPARKVIYSSKSELPKMEVSTGVEYMIKVNDQVYNKFKDDLFFFLGDKWCDKGYSWVFPMDNNILKVGTAKIVSKDVSTGSKSIKQITERIISDYMEAGDSEVIDVHGGSVGTTRDFSENFYIKNVVAIGDSISSINPLGGEGIRYALRSADNVTEHILNYVNKGENTFAKYRKNWRKKYLFTWKLCYFLVDNIYHKYPDKKIDERIKKYHNLVDIDQLINILFEFKFNKMLTRVGFLLLNRVKNKFSKKKNNEAC